MHVGGSAFLSSKDWKVGTADLKACLLFCEDVTVKATSKELASVAESNPETVGWMVENNMLRSIDPTQFMNLGVYPLQERLFRALLDCSFFEHADTVYYERMPLIPIEVAPNMEFKSRSLLDRLIRAGLAFLPGQRFGSNRVRELPYGRRESLDHHYWSIQRYSADRVKSQHQPLLEGLGLRNQSPRMRFAPDSVAPVAFVHPVLYALHLAILECCAPSVGESLGVSLVPVVTTNNARGMRDDPWRSSVAYRVLTSALKHVTDAVADGGERAVIGRVISSDLSTVGVDMSGVPLEDVVEFRVDHRIELQAYRDALFELVQVSSLAGSGEEALQRLLADRVSGLADAADSLRRTSLKRFGLAGSSIAVGAAGFGWFASQGDLVSGLLALLPGMLAAGAVEATPANGFTYALQIETL